MTPSPSVSVIIPVYNGERYLAKALDSVLAQTYPPAEVIVVDDGSTDGTAQVAHRYQPRVQYIFRPRDEASGAATARNVGAHLAQGDCLAFLDADDLWLPHKLHLQVVALTEQADLDMVFGHVQQFISPELPPEVQANLHCPPDPLPGLSASTLLIKRVAFWRVGPFATGWRVGEFTEWYLRAQEAGLRSLMLSAIVLRRRLHRANQGVVKRDAREDYVHIVKAALDRRRTRGAS